MISLGLLFRLALYRDSIMTLVTVKYFPASLNIFLILERSSINIKNSFYTDPSSTCNIAILFSKGVKPSMSMCWCNLLLLSSIDLSHLKSILPLRYQVCSIPLALILFLEILKMLIWKFSCKIFFVYSLLCLYDE